MEAQEMAPPSTSASEYADGRLESLIPLPPRCVPDLDNSSDSLTTQDSRNSFGSVPQSLHIPFSTTRIPPLALEQQQYHHHHHQRFSLSSPKPTSSPVSPQEAARPWLLPPIASLRQDSAISQHRLDILKEAEPFVPSSVLALSYFHPAVGGNGRQPNAPRPISHPAGPTSPYSPASKYPSIQANGSGRHPRYNVRFNAVYTSENIPPNQRPQPDKIPSETAGNVHQEAEAQDGRMAKSLQSTLGKVSPSETLPLSYSRGLVHSSSKDEVKLTNYQRYDTINESFEARISKKGDDPDDDASHCSESVSDLSEEGDDNDYECDNIITWNYSQHDALPSFLPYTRGYGENTSSPCSDSPDSGSTTSGTTSDTPVSSASGLAGGNGLQGNGCTPPSAGKGLPNNGNNPVLRTKEGFGAKVAKPKPLPLICWYPAAGIACNGKHVSSSSRIRHLWYDHAWGKDEGLNHRLSDACQWCKRLFLTEQLLEEHHATCRNLSFVELEELNREPNRLGISRECKKAIEALRKRIEKETRGGKPPVLHDDDTMTLLKQRVDSNVWLYINGSNTSENTAKSELWKWYLIFKKLRPDDELPKNPFLPARQPLGLELVLGGQSRANAHLMFMHNLNQDERLSELDNDQRTALGRVFLDTLEMLGLNQANNGRRSAQNTTANPRKRPRISSPESCERALDSIDLTPAPAAPALATAPTPVEVPPSVRNPGNFQHPLFTPPEVQNQLLPQILLSVPQSSMPSADNLWLLQQQQQEAEDAHLPSPMGDLDYINSWTNYDGLPEFGTRDD